MKREFLKNIQVNGAALPDVIIDTIMQEHTRTLEAATANPGASGDNGGKTFTQEDVNRIVSERLSQERSKLTKPPTKEDEREKALKAREARLDCRDYLDSKKYPAALLDVLDSSDVERFQAAVDKLVEACPGIVEEYHYKTVGANTVPPPYAVGTGTGFYDGSNRIAEAFKPNLT